MNWKDIERIGRETYKLSSEWILSGADASDPHVMQIEFGKKGPRGGWLKGKEHSFKGYISNYKEKSETMSVAESRPSEEQLNLF
jgi:hypothetical protein